jgi:hypothetical protein
MKHLLTALALTLGLVLGALTLTPSTASAHNQDNNSLWGCAATVAGPNYSMDHTWWDGLYPDLVTGRCMAHNRDTGHQRCWRISWYHPGQPDQYFVGTGYDDLPPCWFGEP